MECSNVLIILILKTAGSTRVARSDLRFFRVHHLKRVFTETSKYEPLLKRTENRAKKG